jgi:transcriptional regulator with XRE-family HTH domain
MAMAERKSPSKQSEASNPIAQAFGKRLREVRQSHPPTQGYEPHMSQTELAERCGLHRTTISLLELGLREPRLAQILKLAGSLDVEVGALAGDVLRYEPPDLPPKGQRVPKKKYRGRFHPIEQKPPTN